MTSPARERLEFLDGLRALAAIYITVGHCYKTVWPVVFGVVATGTDASLTMWAMYGHFAVTAFFVISGFCLMLPVVRGDGSIRGGAKEFFLRRAVRVLLPYYASVLLSLLLIWTIVGNKTGAIWDIAIPVEIEHIVKSLLLVQNVYGVGQINPVYYSNAILVQIYLLFPLLVLLRRWLGMPGAAFVFLLAGYLLLWATWGRVHEAAFFHYLGMFALGAVGAELYAKGAVGRRGIPWGAISGICFLTLVIICQQLRWAVAAKHLRELDLLLSVATVSLILFLAGSEKYRHGVLARQPLVGIGRFSYSLYLIHMPLVQAVYQHAIMPMGQNRMTEFALLTAFGVPLSIACAYGFHRVVERPTLMWLRDRDRRLSQDSPKRIISEDVQPADASGCPPVSR